MVSYYQSRCQDTCYLWLKMSLTHARITGLLPSWELDSSGGTLAKKQQRSVLWSDFPLFPVTWSMECPFWGLDTSFFFHSMCFPAAYCWWYPATPLALTSPLLTVPVIWCCLTNHSKTSQSETIMYYYCSWLWRLIGSAGWFSLEVSGIV